MTRIEPPLKWHGGKHYLAGKIIALMPRHIHYVEPYFGGGAVLLAKDPEDVSEVANDINGNLTQFWRILQEPGYFDSFMRRVSSMPFSEREWEEAGNLSIEAGYLDRAVAFFVRCRMSMAGRMKGFAPLSKTRVRRGMNEQASAWMTAIDGLPEVHARLRRVVVLNHPALEVIQQQDGPSTLFYLDPPYLHSTRSTTGEYEHEMTDADHAELLRLLTTIKGKFLLSGYHSPMYEAVARDHRWSIREFNLPNNAAGGTEKKRKTEVVWANYELPGSF